MFKKIFLSFAISFLAFIPVMSPAHAATGVANLKSNLTTFGGNTGLGSDADLKTKIASVINIALGFLGMLATIMIIYAGFKWLTAAGNEDQVTKAKETLRNAVIGIVIIFLSFVIVNFTVNQLTDTVGGGGDDGGGNVVVDPELQGVCVWDGGGASIRRVRCKDQIDDCVSEADGAIFEWSIGRCSATGKCEIYKTDAKTKTQLEKCRNMTHEACAKEGDSFKDWVFTEGGSC